MAVSQLTTKYFHGMLRAAPPGRKPLSAVGRAAVVVLRLPSTWRVVAAATLALVCCPRYLGFIPFDCRPRFLPCYLSLFSQCFHGFSTVN